jgi:hypothetical protein
MSGGVSPTTTRRGPEPPEQEEGRCTDGQRDRDTRDRRGSDGEFGACQLETTSWREKLQQKARIA